MTSTLRIRCLNDEFRSNPHNGVLVTSGIREKGAAFMAAVFEAVQRFDSFTPDNDPHGEHDFGSVEVDGQKVFWKIDYYAADMMGGSPDPSDPAVTTRMMTIMLAREY